ncbi:ATP binding microtubule motor family protein putative isoform 1 [Tripterygium wilfordii]|uniref:ATP binding microtubule motor family protein putative isoform 1 n=1 Tax=Tripterygium wilfordii TaxID=458696 RepID=A0A7J7CBF0_TRIWF|nr:kinesin-like protein KIN-10C isoform X2 [Tripterygium wilfordii]KAF5731187.1 ATP binding microtubule motor family protein putative isoform 1 [Tripterygium wilfordii]
MATPTTPRAKLMNQGRKVRVVAKIRSFSDLEVGSTSEAAATPWILVHKAKGDASESVTISLADKSASRKESWELDYCYEENEDNEFFFKREIEPLISGVFYGHHATVIAYGARGSGKTYVIQGSEEKPGLAVLAIAELLSKANENGKSVTISFYEILHDRVYDLLDPKQLEVPILLDAQGKIKGLSQVPVKSTAEFKKLILGRPSYSQPLQKIGAEFPHRRHKGLTVHVSPNGAKSDTDCVGKMNFVDMAGYEDRRKSTDGFNLVENNKINKALYALQSVVYSLNHNESHVPYRDSKLTHLLRDSLGGSGRLLMINCLNPSFCQDSIYMLSLASRACQGVSRAVPESIKKTNHSARPTILSSQKSQLRRNVSGNTTKTGSRVRLYEKKSNSMVSTIKARKLFDEASHLAKPEKMSEKASSSLDNVSTTEALIEEEEKLPDDAQKDAESASTWEKEAFPLLASDTQKSSTPHKDSSVHGGKDYEEVTPIIMHGTTAFGFVGEGHNLDKENHSSLINEDGSPPISSQLQELSNKLKQLYYSSTPLCIEMPAKNDAPTPLDIVEPQTPERSVKVDGKCEVASPWERFSACSAGMKKSLVQGYVNFLNSASKEELKKLKGIGEKRATYILQLREKSPEPFKSVDDLKDIGLSAKQVKEMMKKEVGDLFN